MRPLRPNLQMAIALAMKLAVCITSDTTIATALDDGLTTYHICLCRKSIRVPLELGFSMYGVEKAMMLRSPSSELLAGGRARIFARIATPAAFPILDARSGTHGVGFGCRALIVGFKGRCVGFEGFGERWYRKERRPWGW